MGLREADRKCQPVRAVDERAAEQSVEHEPLHVGGMELGELFGFLPTPPGVGLGVGIGTYAGRAALSVACDRALLGADPAHDDRPVPQP